MVRGDSCVAGPKTEFVYSGLSDTFKVEAGRVFRQGQEVCANHIITWTNQKITRVSFMTRGMPRTQHTSLEPISV